MSRPGLGSDPPFGSDREWGVTDKAGVETLPRWKTCIGEPFAVYMVGREVEVCEGITSREEVI